MVEWILGVIIVICIVTFIMYWKGWIESAMVGWGSFLIGLVTTGIGGYLVYKEFTPTGQLIDRQYEVDQLDSILAQAQTNPSVLLQNKAFLRDNGALSNTEISALESGVATSQDFLADIQETIAEKKVEMGRLSDRMKNNALRAKDTLKRRKQSSVPRTKQSAIKKRTRKTSRRRARKRRGGGIDDDDSSSSDDELITSLILN